MEGLRGDSERKENRVRGGLCRFKVNKRLLDEDIREAEERKLKVGGVKRGHVRVNKPLMRSQEPRVHMYNFL